MNTSDPQHPWSRLAASARTVPADADTAAPFGFATRVVALAMTQERKVVSLFERFSFRALGVAGLLAVVSLAANYSLIVGSSGSVADDEGPDDDAVTVLLAD